MVSLYKLVKADTHSELGALARQVREQVRGGRQTGWCYVGVGRVRQLMKTPNSLQTAGSIRASEESNQEMHAVLLPTVMTGLHTNMTHEKHRCKQLQLHLNKNSQPYLMKVSCAVGSWRALLKALRWASLSGPLC